VHESRLTEKHCNDRVQLTETGSCQSRTCGFHCHWKVGSEMGGFRHGWIQALSQCYQGSDWLHSQVGFLHLLANMVAWHIWASFPLPSRDSLLLWSPSTSLRVYSHWLTLGHMPSTEASTLAEVMLCPHWPAVVLCKMGAGKPGLGH
jgi:hypothetical protein